MCDVKNIKAVFIDIDRTLTNSTGQVPIENSQAIKRLTKKGIYVVLCSGRGFAYTTRKAKEANASQYIISSNGAHVYDYLNKKTLYSNNISKNTLKKVLDEFNDEGIDCILNTTTTRFGTTKLMRKIDENEKFFSNVEEVENQDVVQIVGEVKAYDDMKKMVNIVKKHDDLIILNLSKAYLQNKRNQKGYYADINSNTVNKGEGIKKFIEIFNVDKKDTLCFGDYINDVDMFDVCKYKVAMGNASEELKEKADFVTLSNDEAGVGYFIEKYIL